MVFSKKKKLTTDDARKTKLPTGTKVISTQKSVNAAAKKAAEKVNRVEEFKKKTQNMKIYEADLSTINETLNDIRRHVIINAQSDYAVKNIFIILQDALKKVKLSQN